MIAVSRTFSFVCLKQCPPRARLVHRPHRFVHHGLSLCHYRGQGNMAIVWAFLPVVMPGRLLLLIQSMGTHLTHLQTKLFHTGAALPIGKNQNHSRKIFFSQGRSISQHTVVYWMFTPNQLCDWAPAQVYSPGLYLVFVR